MVCFPDFIIEFILLICSISFTFLDNHNHRHVKNEMAMKKQEIDANFLNQLSLFQKAMQASQQQQQQQQPQINRSSSKRNMSLIQQVPYNHHNKSTTNGSHNNNNNNHHNRLSLIKPPDRYKPYDLKVRPHNSNNNNNNGSNNESFATQQIHPTHRISKSHPIVPPLPQSTNIYSNVQQQQQRSSHQNLKLYNNNHLNNSNNNNNNNNNNHFERDNENSLIRHPKSKSNRQHSVDMSFKESLTVPEADKNNNTTLNNCNVTITSTSKPALNGNSNQPLDLGNITIPQIPASMVDGSTDSDANLVPKNFIDGQFPAGISKFLFFFVCIKFDCYNVIIFFCQHSELTESESCH